jgi:hypothetical protein
MIFFPIPGIAWNVLCEVIPLSSYSSVVFGISRRPIILSEIPFFLLFFSASSGKYWDSSLPFGI